MVESPRIRRLRSDLKVLQDLKRESSILDFLGHGSPPEFYTIRFAGRGLARQEETGRIYVATSHEVTIGLGANYPRMLPELRWKSPVFHPNISASGVVCLGGYGTNWAPSLTLDELCVMLWDMLRYANYDTESPYNREAAIWTREQREFAFPIDARPLRDLTAAGLKPRVAESVLSSPVAPAAAVSPVSSEEEIVFLEPANGRPTREAETPAGESEILFLE